MKINKQQREEELVLVFVWNDCINQLNNFVKYAEKMLSRDVSNPFSRAINIPMFFYKGHGSKLPSQINLYAKKLIIFAIIDIETVADKNWNDYYEGLVNIENSIVIPIAFEKDSILTQGILKDYNHIRAYEIKDHFDEKLFLRIAHEIYRVGLNDKKTDIGSEAALKVFISHAKDNAYGIDVAQKIKKYIDDSDMRTFFDTYDIAAGYRFDDEIKNNIVQSTMLLVNSDIYSSRYWCQREILTAKNYERPIVEIDALEKGLDRKFPYASNIPVVKIKLSDGFDEQEILRVLIAALLETIRFFYSMILLSKNKKDSTRVCCRPPEIVDIEKILRKDSRGNIVCQSNKIIYPDPPVYSEEIHFIEEIGIEVVTPLTDKKYCIDKKIGISISGIEKDELIVLGQNESHLVKLSQTIARYLIGLQSFLVYGGDLRDDGFTNNLVLESRIMKDRYELCKPHLINYLAWPVYLKDKREVLEWKAKNKDYIQTIHVECENSVKNEYIDFDNSEHAYLWAEALTKMRKSMIEICDARIFAGGAIKGYKGKMPGVLEEFLITAQKGCPIFLIGGFGGISKLIGSCILDNLNPIELTNSWQATNNKYIEDIQKIYTEKGDSIDYDNIVTTLKGVKFNNGLSVEDNKILFESVYVEEITELILKGLYNLFGK